MEAVVLLGSALQCDLGYVAWLLPHTCSRGKLYPHLSDLYWTVGSAGKSTLDLQDKWEASHWAVSKQLGQVRLIGSEPLDVGVSFTDGPQQAGAPARMGAVPGAFPEQLSPKPWLSCHSGFALLFSLAG